MLLIEITEYQYDNMLNAYRAGPWLTNQQVYMLVDRGFHIPAQTYGLFPLKPILQWCKSNNIKFPLMYPAGRFENGRFRSTHFLFFNGTEEQFVEFKMRWL